MILVYHGTVDNYSWKSVSANGLLVDIVVLSGPCTDLGMLDPQESTATHKGFEATTAVGHLYRGTDLRATEGRAQAVGRSQTMECLKPEPWGRTNRTTAVHWGRYITQSRRQAQ